MEISVVERDDVQVVSLSGVLDARSADQMRDVFRPAIEAGVRHFVLDASSLAAMDSAVIGETVACFKRAREKGGEVKLVIAPEGKIHELLRMTTLDRILDILTDTDEAVASFAE